MRPSLLILLGSTLALTASAVLGQDAAMQQMQMAQQANQQAMQDAQIASETCPACAATATPKFSLASGPYPAATLVRLKTRSRSAHIFYTTDGWTPTPQSIPYTGPIPLTESETIQAIAISPGAARSRIAKAQYTVPSGAPAPPTFAPIRISQGSIELPQNTPLPLLFTTRLDSQTANIGDIVPLALASDLVVNGVVIVPKGTPAQAKVTAVDPAGRGGLPGVVSFALVSIRINGVDVALAGTRTRQGLMPPQHLAYAFIPVAGAGMGVASMLKHGDPAEIPANTQVTALVAANTHIPTSSKTP